MNKVIGRIIDNRQSGFIKNRSIFDSIYTTNVLFENSISDPNRTNGYLIMIDQEKAYDRVDWVYMYKCLEKFGFSQSFIDSLRNIYEGSNTRVCINGTLTEPIIIEQGQRQGDPLSPLL
ncbi:Transposon TX1 protein [Smittium culicis]|uniref:Transposon TX1 protein n=1 Tax=Smittium culicis TaxID=133412 RepID=A0A1R1WYK6_9FUNG|nr:Transposon TX1 protein [Smittium culicis]